MTNLCMFTLAGGNGKSTIAAHACSPRMPGASFFAVETVNETAGGLGVEVEKIDGERFSVLYKKLLAADGAIIDVGASNAEEFLDGLVKFDGVQAEIDRFVIPVVPGTREFKEAIRAGWPDKPGRGCRCGKRRVEVRLACSGRNAGSGVSAA